MSIEFNVDGIFWLVLADKKRNYLSNIQIDLLFSTDQYVNKVTLRCLYKSTIEPLY